jgi:hypothetical protein
LHTERQITGRLTARVRNAAEVEDIQNKTKLNIFWWILGDESGNGGSNNEKKEKNIFDGSQPGKGLHELSCLQTCPEKTTRSGILVRPEN